MLLVLTGFSLQCPFLIGHSVDETPGLAKARLARGFYFAPRRLTFPASH